MLDFGSGPGTAALAVASMWPASVREIVAVELSRDMLELADVLRESMNAADESDSAGAAAAPRPRDAVPPSRVVPHLSRLNGRQQRRHYDIVVAAFSLGELPNEVRICLSSVP
jgi:ribosomal protein RSM22 (predicted rRNA methylase)